MRSTSAVRSRPSQTCWTDRRTWPGSRPISLHASSSFSLSPAAAPGLSAPETFQTSAHPAGGGRDRGEQRPALVDRPFGAVRADGGKVVEVPHMVEARIVRDPPDVSERLDGGRLSRVLQPDTKRMHHRLA